MARVLEINATYKKGSTGVLMAQIGDVLKKDKIDVFYATPDVHMSECTYRIGNKIDQKLHAILCRVVGIQGYFSYFTTASFIRWIKRIKPDIIHIHNLHSNYINYIMLFKYIKKNNIKTIITLHDCWFLTGKCFHFLYDGCMEWKKKCGNCPRKCKEQSSMFFDFSRKVLADKKHLIGENKNVQIVAVSEWIASIAKESILKDRPITVIHNGIDLDIFHYFDVNINKLNKKIPKDSFIILVMANKWFALENIDISKKILEKLKDNMRIVVVGCEERQISNDSRVICVGRLTAHQLAQYYSVADVFVNLTKVDSFPTVNMEAIACGTPVVTFDSGGSKESVIDGKTGFVIPYGDVELLMEKIDVVQKLGKITFSKDCLDIARKTFDKGKCFKNYLYLVKNLLESR